MNLAKYIDHTILKPQTTEEQVKTVCAEAREHGFFSVCVNPCYVSLVKEELEGSETKVCSVISFPLVRIFLSESFEATKAIADGADEIDMVINIGALKDGKFDYVREDIKLWLKRVKAKLFLR